MNLKAILLLLLIVTSYQVNSQSNTDSLSILLQAKMDSFPHNTYLSIAIVNKDSIRYIGLHNKDEGTIYLDLKDSLFEIGSVTKVFTSTVLANGLFDGRIDSNEDINDQFKFAFKDSIQLTYLDLSTHTSGLPRLPSNIYQSFMKSPTNPYRDYSSQDLEKYLKNEMQLEQSDEPNYGYSNLGAGLLAYALSNRENLEFEDLLKQEIFEKYQMESTSYSLNTSVHGYNYNGSKIDNWTFDALKGAGGLISCTSDLVKFIQAHFDPTNEALALSRKAYHTVSNKMSIGLGWHILKPNTEKEKYWHNGGTGGFTASVAFRTSNETAVIILSNLSALNKYSPLIDETCFELLDAMK